MSSTTSPCDSSTEDDIENMARTTSKSALVRRVEIDLTCLLSNEQLLHLSSLIAAILDGIETQAFESLEQLGSQSDGVIGIQPPPVMCFTVANPQSDLHKAAYGQIEINPSTYHEVLAEVPSGTAALRKVPQSLEEASSTTSQSQHELLIESVRELQKDLKVYYAKFRAGIEKRVQDIVVRNGGTAGDPGTGTNMRRPAPFTKQRSTQNYQRLTEASQPAPLELLRYTLGSEYVALSSLSNFKRGLILHCVLLLVLGLEQYASYSTALLEHLASALKVPKSVLIDDEVRLGAGLAELVDNIPADELIQRRLEESARQVRRPRGGNPDRQAAPVSVSSALNPCLTKQGIGSMFQGRARIPTGTASALLGTLNESTVVVGSMFGLYGGRVGGKALDTYAKDVQDFGLLPLGGDACWEFLDPKDVPAQYRRLRMCFVVSGWITDDSSHFRESWKALGRRSENYTLQWETDAVLKMGQALKVITKSKAWNQARKDTISKDVFSCLMRSLWPSSLVKINKVVENPWIVGIVRAEKAGQVLAETLLNRVQGERGVSLIGFSLGARVIYSCLMTLAEKRAFGLVDNVVLMGAPIPTEMRVWAAMRSVVTGRMVNAYSGRDFILGFLSRSTNWQYGIAGLQEVQGVANVENLDLGDMVSNHFRYQHLTSHVLQRLGWEDLDPKQVVQDQQQHEALVASEAALDVQRDVEIEAEMQATRENVQESRNTIVEYQKSPRSAPRSRGHRTRRPGHGRGGSTGVIYGTQTSRSSPELGEVRATGRAHHENVAPHNAPSNKGVMPPRTGNHDLPFRSNKSKGGKAYAK